MHLGEVEGEHHPAWLLHHACHRGISAVLLTDSVVSNPRNILGTGQAKVSACNHLCALFHLPVLPSPPFPLPDPLCLLFNARLPFNRTVGCADLSPFSLWNLFLLPLMSSPRPNSSWSLAFRISSLQAQTASVFLPDFTAILPEHWTVLGHKYIIHFMT